MPGTFFGLESAVRSLRAQQTAVDVVNHNIANANTPGYSRQEAVMAAATPYTVPAVNRDPSAGQVGTGVEVTRIRRTRDSFVDYQLRNELATMGRWEAARDSFQQVESVLNEPSTSGINTLLSRFWQSWEELANAPSDGAVRASLVEQGKALATAIGYAYQQLGKFAQDADLQIRLTVDDVNSIADRLAALNAQVAQVELSGQQANDLTDERDLLLDQLSRQTKVAVAIAPNGMAQVFMGNRLLVDGSSARHLQAVTTMPYGLAEVQWASDGEPANVTGGSLRGLLDQRGDTAQTTGVLPDLKAKLDGIASDLISAVNGQHVQGFGLDDAGSTPPGRLFFAGSGAADIAVAGDVADNPRNVAAASQAGAPGDSSNAIAIVRALSGSGVSAKYQALIAGLGVQTRTASETVDNQDVLVRHLQRRREALSGVSLDEETVNLLKYQQAYEASARVITAVDQMLDTLINQTGVVGR